MKTQILACLFFIICCEPFSYCACEIALIPQPMSTPKQLNHVFESVGKMERKDEPRTIERKGLHEVKVGGKSFQKLAKGVYGGPDNLRPRPKSKSGSTCLLLKSSALLSPALGFITFVVFF